MHRSIQMHHPILNKNMEAVKENTASRWSAQPIPWRQESAKVQPEKKENAQMWTMLQQ